MAQLAQLDGYNHVATKQILSIECFGQFLPAVRFFLLHFAELFTANFSSISVITAIGFTVLRQKNERVNALT